MKLTWFIELDGVVLGQLIDAKYEDMFWTSYEVVPKDEDSKKVLLK